MNTLEFLCRCYASGILVRRNPKDRLKLQRAYPKLMPAEDRRAWDIEFKKRRAAILSWLAAFPLTRICTGCGNPYIDPNSNNCLCCQGTGNKTRILTRPKGLPCSCPPDSLERVEDRKYEYRCNRCGEQWFVYERIERIV